MTNTYPLKEVVPYFDSVQKLNDKISSLASSSTVVYTYGAWDLLHPGHVIFLSRAKMLGDFLVVGVVADLPIRELKGITRPIQTQEERIITSGSLRDVDAVITQSDYDPTINLEQLQRIDILTKGDDWDYIPGTQTIEKLGGKLIKLNYSKGYSTSKLVEIMKSESYQSEL
jgi:rfaE bifunctional protein nucleotidyltransferase chain/domain